MLKKLATRSLNKNGTSTVSLCVMVLALFILVCFVLAFVQAINWVNFSRDCAKSALDDVTRSGSIFIMREIKQASSTYSETRLPKATTKFNTNFQTLVGMTYDESTGLYSKIHNGARTFQTSKGTVYKAADDLSLIVEYKIYVSVYFAGTVYEDLSIPVTIRVKSDLESKL